MKQEDINAATENLKKMFGMNMDDDTGDMISSMIKNITDEIKNTESTSLGSIDGFLKIAETVAQKMIPTMDKKKAEKMMESTKNLANFNDGDEKNPMNLVSKLLSGMSGTGGIGGMSGMNPAQMMQSMMSNVNNTQINKCNELIKNSGINVKDLDISKLNLKDITKMIDGANKQLEKK